MADDARAMIAQDEGFRTITTQVAIYLHAVSTSPQEEGLM